MIIAAIMVPKHPNPNFFAPQPANSALSKFLMVIDLLFKVRLNIRAVKII